MAQRRMAARELLGAVATVVLVVAAQTAPAQDSPERIALVCIGTELDGTATFQFRWGREAAWQESSVDPGYWRPLYFTDGATAPEPLQLQYEAGGPVVVELVSEVAPEVDCINHGTKYFFAKGGDRLVLTSEEGQTIEPTLAERPATASSRGDEVVPHRYTAPNGLFSSDVPVLVTFAPELIEERFGEDGSFAVVWTEDGYLARIDGVLWQEGAATRGADRTSIIENELVKTAELYGAPERARLLEREVVPGLAGGAGYLSAFMSGGSHVVASAGDGPEQRLDAARTALLVFKGNHLLRLSFAATSWDGALPGQDLLALMKAKTLAFADTVVFAVLPEFFGEAMAGWQLRADAYVPVATLFEVTNNCGVESIETSVIAVGHDDNGEITQFKELWIARGCGRAGRYDVSFFASDRGGFDYSVGVAD